MATKPMTNIAGTNGVSNVQEVSQKAWLGMANGDDGQPYAGSNYADKSVQVTGTFGAGGTLVWEGTIDGATYSTLKNLQGNDLAFTAPGILLVPANTYAIRPRVSSGDGTTNLNAYLMAKS